MTAMERQENMQVSLLAQDSKVCYNPLGKIENRKKKQA